MDNKTYCGNPFCDTADCDRNLSHLKGSVTITAIDNIRGRIETKEGITIEPMGICWRYTLRKELGG